ncbi:MAG: serine/threonine-protein kinase, partial [Actinomycetota bacterium]
MNSENWQTIEEIVISALEQPKANQREFLNENCGDDTDLRREVESLLMHYEADFLERRDFEIVVETVFSGTVSSLIGKQIGAFRVIREIGEGGMGAVFLAERVAGDFTQQAAIKIVRTGLDSAEIRRRFRHERQILSNLEHPNIARLLDGGTTADGLPFFIMEFVAGLPVTEFCAAQNLNIAERLKLFLKICRAVAYAHQNLVVHRDLKPSNIFVTAPGEPKLLDFGIAKLLDNKKDAARTQTDFRAYTPDYASPEQINSEKITTTSDIYSLGKVLSELIQNSKFKVNSSNKNRLPKSDLQNIVAMALREEPERRYQFIEQLADDIERYLKGLPVAARPNTFNYRASKFIKRHKVGVFAASLVFLSLIGGTITTTWQARAVQREKEKAESINAFLEQTLKYSNPILSNLRKNGQETTVNEVLDEAARRLDSGEFDSSPEVKAELERTVGASYIGQGKYNQARKHFEQYVVLLKELYGENHPKMIEGSIIWADLLFDKGEIDESEKTYRRYLPLLKNEYQKGSLTAETLANTLNNFAYLRRTQGDSREAEALFRETLALIPKLS